MDEKQDADELLHNMYLFFKGNNITKYKIELRYRVFCIPLD